MAVNVAVLANNLLKALIRESLVFPCQKLCGCFFKAAFFIAYLSEGMDKHRPNPFVCFILQQPQYRHHVLWVRPAAELKTVGGGSSGFRLRACDMPPAKRYDLRRVLPAGFFETTLHGVPDRMVRISDPYVKQMLNRREINNGYFSGGIDCRLTGSRAVGLHKSVEHTDDYSFWRKLLRIYPTDAKVRRFSYVSIGIIKISGGYCVVITYQAAKNIVLNVLVLLLSVSFWQIVKAHADSPQSNGV